MTISSLVDRVIFNPASAPGLSNFVVATAKVGYLTPAQATAVNGSQYSYAAETRNATTGAIEEWEVGQGIYSTGSVTLARTTVIFSSNSNAKVNFSAVPDVMLTMLAEDVAAGASGQPGGTGNQVQYRVNGTTFGGFTLGGDATLDATTGTMTIANFAITTAKIATSAVIESKIADFAVSSAKIATSAVTNEKIADFAVTTAKIATSAVTTEKIADDAVTFAKMQNISASFLIGRGSAGGAGDPELIVVGSGLSMSGTTLSATGGGGDSPGAPDTAVQFRVNATTLGGDAEFLWSSTTNVLSLGTTNVTSTISFGNLNARITNSVSNELLVAAQSTLMFGTAGTTERMRVDNSGKFTFSNIGGFAPTTGPFDAFALLETANGTFYSLGLFAVGTGVVGGGMFQAKTRGTSAASHSAVLNGDYLGAWDFAGSDGTTYQAAASMVVRVDGATISSTSMPGRFEFHTRPSGSTDYVQRLRVDSIGNVILMTGTTLSTSATSAFVYISSMAGVPTGSPATASYTGAVPLVVDTSDTRLYGYYSGAWNNLSGSGGGGSPGAPDTAVQFRVNATTFGGSDSFIFNSTTVVAQIGTSGGGQLQIGGGPVGADGASMFQVIHDGSVFWHASCIGYGNNNNGVNWVFAKTRNATASGNTIVQDGDGLGAFHYYGSDGTAMRRAAAFSVQVDGAPGSASMPGRFLFRTTPTGTTNPVERMRVDNSGLVTVGSGGNVSVASQSSYLQVQNQSGLTANLLKFGNDADPAILSFAKTRNATAGGGTVVNNGDILGRMSAYAYNGSAYTESGRWQYYVDDSSPNTTSVQGSFVFSNQDAGGTMTDRFRIEGVGRISMGEIGIAAEKTIFDLWPTLTIDDDGTFYVQQSINRYGNDTDGGYLVMAKSRHTTIGLHTAVFSSDVLGSLIFAGSDGGEFIAGAGVFGQVDNTVVGNDSMPSRLEFGTTRDGGSFPTERLRVDSRGNVILMTGTTLSTSATTAFIYISSMEGIPTGAPATASYTGAVPLVIDTTDNRLYGFYGSVWNNLSASAGTGGTGEPGGAPGQIQYQVNATTFGGSSLGWWANASAVLVVSSNSSPFDTFESGATLPMLQVNGTGGDNGIGISRWSNSVNGAKLMFAKSLGGLGSYTAGAVDDTIGIIGFSHPVTGGASGFQMGAAIYGKIDGTTVGGGSPARLEFHTAPVNSTTVLLRAFIRSNGYIYAGTNISAASPFGSGGIFNIAANTNNDDAINFVGYTANTFGPNININYTRGTTPDVNTIVQAGDGLGWLNWQGANGVSSYRRAAYIAVTVEGTPSTSSVAGRMEFATRPDGGASVLERLRIDNTGNVVMMPGATLSTSATTSFLYITSMAGVPTGAPATASYTGTVPIVVDTTDTRLYGYYSGVWNNLSGSGGGGSPGAPDNSVQFRTNATTFGGDAEFMWDNTNKILSVGSTAILGKFLAGAVNGKSQVLGTSGEAMIGVARFSNGATSGRIHLAKSRGTAVNTYTAVVADDVVGQISFEGVATTAFFDQAAIIQGAIDGTVTATALPGRLQFYTTPTGSLTPAERMRITNGGNVVIREGGGAAETLLNSPALQVLGMDTGPSSLGTGRWSNNAAAPFWVLAKSRGTTIGSLGIVSTGDVLGQLTWAGDTGFIGFIEAATIAAEVEGTPGNTSVAARLLFKTALDGASGATERMRITNEGRVLIQDPTAATGAVTVDGFIGRFQTINTQAANWHWVNLQNRNSAGGAQVAMAHSRSTTPGAQGIVQDGDDMMTIWAYGSDGVQFRPGGWLNFAVDGSPSTTSMPGRFQVATVPRGSVIATERLRVDNWGNLGITPGTTLSTSATTSFVFISSMAGVPTGAPLGTSSFTGTVPIVVDTTDTRLYGYYGGAWNNLSPAAGTGGGTPGGANTQVQFNDGGSFGGDSNFVFEKTNDLLTLGHTTSFSTFDGTTPKFQEHSTGIDGISATRWGGSNGPKFWLTHSGGGIGTYTTLGDGSMIGEVMYAFPGDSGSDFNPSASVRAIVDGTSIGTADSPGAILLMTQPRGGFLTERMRVDNAGILWQMTAPVPGSATPSDAKGNMNTAVSLYAHAAFGGV